MGDWLSSYTRFLARFKRSVCLIWLAILAGGIVGVVNVFPSLKLTVDAVPGDVNEIAHSATRSAFTQADGFQSTIVLLTASDGVTNLTALPAARQVAERCSAVAGPYISSGLLTSDSGASFFSYNDTGLTLLAAGFVAGNGSEMIVSFTTTVGFVITREYTAFLLKLRSELSSALSDAGGILSGDVTGGLVVTSDSTSSILLDVAVSDSITVSISFLLLAMALRSLRLIAFAFASLVAAFGGAFLLIWPLTTSMNVPNFTTSLVISTLISLSLDYSLFLLSHVKGSLERGVAMEQAVEDMLRSSGHTVLVSGATLASCFLVLATQPVSIVRAPGIATTFAVFFSVAANLTLTPVLLLLFPEYASARLWKTTTPPCFSKTGERILVLDAALTRGVRWAWLRIAYVTKVYKYSIAFGLCAALLAPFAFQLRYFAVSQTLRNIVPRDAASVRALYGNEFGPSLHDPARLLGVAKPPYSALSVEFFESAQAAISAVLSVSGGVLTSADVSGLAWPHGNASAVAGAIAQSSACPVSNAAACRAVCPVAACMLQLQAARTLSPNAMLFNLAISFSLNQNAKRGLTWGEDVRNALAPVSSASAASWYLVVDPSPLTTKYVFDHFGDLVGITIGVIFVILLAAFKSPFVSLRALITLAVMEVTVWGGAVAVYTRGWLHRGGVLETFRGDDGLFWLMPIRTSLAVFFTLLSHAMQSHSASSLVSDSTMICKLLRAVSSRADASRSFILTAVFEEREAGWSDDDAISIGLQRSGPVISWAGCIMAVAYGGFLFASIPLLNQLGYFIVFAVLIDTFVIRPLLVPSLMHILGGLNYWPAHMPAAKYESPDLLASPSETALPTASLKTELEMQGGDGKSTVLQPPEASGPPPEASAV